MRATLSILALLVLSAFGAVLLNHAESHDGRYIVVFHDHATQDHRDEVISKVNARRKRSENDDLKHHSVDDFNAFSGALDKETIEEILKEKSVSYISPNMKYELSACQMQSKAPWHLERLNNRRTPRRFNQTYAFSVTAENVDAYIMDSGIDISHKEFEGRAIWAINTADRLDEDCNGHGTHVAGTVGSRSFGVAKKVNLLAVKVMNCGGRGDSIGMMEGHEFITKEYVKRNKKPSVVNMSLGSQYDRAHNDIVTRAIRQGLVYVIAAGNEQQDACRVSPASVSAGITVGATNIQDEITDFSNYGVCVHIMAPGEEITSTWPRGGTNTISGTSMASPHVAGAAALFLSSNPTATPLQVREALVKASTPDVIKNGVYLRGAPNNLLYANCEASKGTKVITQTKVIKTFTRTRTEVVEQTGTVSAIGPAK